MLNKTMKLPRHRYVITGPSSYSGQGEMRVSVHNARGERRHTNRERIEIQSWHVWKVVEDKGPNPTLKSYGKLLLFLYSGDSAKPS
jgi:hypothetical protein